MKIAVIIPTRDRPAELRRLLRALEGQTRRPDEVLIVDSSRPPQTPPATTLNARLIHSAPGVCRQRNRGARESSGDLLYFFDDDVIPSPDFIEILEADFQTHPEYHGGVGTLRTETRRGSPGWVLCRLFLLQSEFGDGRFQRSGMARYPYGTSRFRDTEVMGSGLMAVRRSVFTEDRIEFDERLPLGQDDDDFSRRLSLKRRLFFDPRAKVEHTQSTRGRPRMYERGRRYMFSYRYLYFKNFYPRARWTLPAHWWALAGMFAVAAATGAWDDLRGYAEGLREYRRMQRGRSMGLLEPP